MPDYQQALARLVHGAERAFDRVKYRLGDALRRPNPVIIYPYLGYGSSRFIHLRGRVLEDKGIAPASETDSAWVNLRTMYRRFESDEVPYARVLARFQGQEGEFQADEEGYFEVNLELDGDLQPDSFQVEVELELLEPRGLSGLSVTSRGRAVIVSPRAAFGVISDIDDTVIHTGATSLLLMARTVFLRNAHTRLPLEGVAEFYRALRGENPASPPNPLFYVSSSPWNLYDLLEHFFQIHGLPEGPLILRDWGIGGDSRFSFRHTKFKLAAIRTILDSYPDLPFIIIGDSGEKDPEIYAEVIRLYPGRILAAYIREARRHASRRASIQVLFKEIESRGGTMLLAPDTQTMALHAAEREWIE